MKLNARIGENTHQIEIVETDGKVTASVDGRSYQVEALEPEPNVFLLKSEGRVFEAFVSPQTDPAAPLQVRVGTREFEIGISDPKDLRSAAGVGEQADGVAEIKTAMHGKVVRILKAVGDAVEKGEGVIVVEAMKMQNEMKSPKDGVIKDLKAAEGDSVKGGQILVTIE